MSQPMPPVTERGAASRRQFLQTAGALAVTAWAGPAAFAGRDEGTVLGQAARRYRVVPGWGQLDPEKHPVNDCHGAVQDSRGRIIVLTNHTDNNILIYNKAGKLLDAFGHDYPGAHGLSLVREGGEDLLWLTDHNRHEVYKMTLRGEVLMKLGYPAESGQYESAKQFKPTKAVAGPDGTVFVCDGYGLSYVMRYDTKGNYLGIFGGTGDEPGHLKTPHGAMIDRRDPDNPTLLIASRGQQALKWFTLGGEHIKTVPMPGARVCDIDQRNGLLFVPNLNGYVSVLDESNRVVSNLGGTKPQYAGGKLKKMRKDNDLFIHPHSITVDDEGALYIVQWNSKQTYPVKLEPADA